MLSQANTWCTLAPVASLSSSGESWLQGSVGEAHMTFGCFLMQGLQLPKGSRGGSRLGANDLVVTILLPSLLGRTAAYAHYEEEPCREQMTTGEFASSV